MLELIRKDVAAARRMLLFVIPIAVLQLAVTASVGPVFLAFAFAFSGLLAFGSIPLEELQHTEILWNSLPLKRSEIVTARYLTVLIGILVGLALSWAVGQATTRLIPAGPIDPAHFVGLRAHALLFGLLVFAAAAFLPFFFRCGAGRGLLLFAAATAGALMIVAVTVQLIIGTKGYSDPGLDPARMEEAAAGLARGIDGLLTLFAASSVLALACSCLLSRRLYEARDL